MKDSASALIFFLLDVFFTTVGSDWAGAWRKHKSFLVQSTSDSYMQAKPGKPG